jgi:tyrosine-protein phosphatase
MAHTHIAEVSEHPPLETIQSPVEPPSEPLSIEEEEEQNFDIPLSQEVKPEAYPDGPICVYEPHIDLYLEPTAEQVRQYDVILNVASEVRNPLLRSDDPAPVEPEMRLDGGGGIQFKPRADRDHLVIPKQDPHENLSEDVCNSPSTPKAPQTIAHGPKTEGASKDPEYIHIKWEHNSDIVPDLLNLCKLIDDRVAQGKRVLIHCQCGVSRSASLVVAYGLYKSPTMSVQEAYDSVKRRSKWIGPNMNLIMQLQEFRSSLARGGLLTSRTTMSPLTPASALSEWSGPFTGTSSTGMLELPSVNPGGGVSPGPSSAPSGVPWPISDKLVTQRKTSVGAMKPAGPFVDTSGHVLSGLPVVEVVAPDKRASEPVGRTNSHATTPKAEVEPEPVSSPRSTEFAMAPLQPPKDVDPADAFGILSPTSTEFTINPFDRSSLLASLGMGSMQDDEAPTRQRASLRTRQCPQQQSTQETRITEPHPRKLRGKISSPSIREERELRSLQAKIEANLLLRNRSFTPPDEGDANAEALLSPRATEFTSNPFTFSTIPPASVAEPSEDPRSPIVDPRSPAQKGANPITRNILDVL